LRQTKKLPPCEIVAAPLSIINEHRYIKK